MKKSILDKIFFIDKINEDINTIVDFGCADGNLIKYLHNLFPTFNYIGYDNNIEMINLAKSNFDKALYYDQWAYIKKQIVPQSSLLNVSSVIHEIYSFCNKLQIDNFWNQVFNSNFKYISIRDLMISKKTIHNSNINDILKIKSYSDEKILNDFENKWGDISFNHNLIHYLLKYRFKENWERENQENYIGLCLEDFLKIIPIDKYEVVYFNHYTLPFLCEKVKEDMDIQIRDNTHMKILLKRKV